MWRVYRDPLKSEIGNTALTPDVDLVSFTDTGAVDISTGSRHYYYLRGLDCNLQVGP